MTSIPTLSLELRAELEAWERRVLSPAEFAARVNAAWSESEREDFDALVTWFNRRYPTPAARLQATRHLIGQWRKTRP